MSIEQTPAELATESTSDETLATRGVFSGDASETTISIRRVNIGRCRRRPWRLWRWDSFAVGDFRLVAGVDSADGRDLGHRGVADDPHASRRIHRRRLAIAGTVLAVLFWVGGFVALGYIYATEVPEGFERIDYSILQPLPDEPPDRVRPTRSRWMARRYSSRDTFIPVSGSMALRSFCWCAIREVAASGAIRK